MKYPLLLLVPAFLFFGCNPSPVIQFNQSIESANSVKIVIYSENGLDSTIANLKGKDKMKGLTGLLSEKKLNENKCTKTGKVVYFSSDKQLNEFEFSVAGKCAAANFSQAGVLYFYALSDSGYEGLRQIYSFGMEQLEGNQLQKSLQPFVGNWEQTGPKSKMQEAWRFGEKHLLEGRGFEIDLKGKVLFAEDIFIDTLAGMLTYSADLGEGPEDFPLEKMGNGDFIFSRVGDDWPQKIQYTFSGKDTAIVVLDGSEKGKSNRQELVFIRQKDGK